jgi:hypothetical protein
LDSHEGRSGGRKKSEGTDKEMENVGRRNTTKIKRNEVKRIG